MINLAIIEHDKTEAKKLQSFFEEDITFDIVFCATSAEDIVQHELIKADIVLCNIALPGMSGVEIAGIIKEKHPKVKVVIYTKEKGSKEIFRSIEAGASGYLLKGTPLSEVREELSNIWNGGIAFSPSIAKKVIDYFKLIKELPGEEPKFFEKLTAREFDVLTKIQIGKSNNDIAEELSVSPNTVKFHNRNIYKKLKIKSRSQLRELL